MSDQVRVRFAPSPTGYLHIGGARTALFNWLYARSMGGVFVLRVEDTDRARSTEDAIRAIQDGMQWLGMAWDEGPLRQMDRMERYRSVAEELRANGHAYECFCAPEELAQRRDEAKAAKVAFKYDLRCLRLDQAGKQAHRDAGRQAVIRVKSPDTGTAVVHDLVRGDVSFENALLDDYIILRGDGVPTYNFAVVVDDHDMNITHVIRGEDHLSNTPRQMVLYRALGWDIPEFAHLPMILGSDKTRLSKRHGATAVETYRDEGYLADALVNYLALMGWSRDDASTVIPPDELIRDFSLDRVGKAPAVFDPDKLKWMNGEYIRSKPVDELVGLIAPFLEAAGYGAVAADMRGDGRLAGAIAIIQERIFTLGEAAGMLEFLMVEDIELDPASVEKVLRHEKAQFVLETAVARLRTLEPFTHDAIEETLRGMVADTGLRAKEAFQPIRVAVTGSTVSPPLFESIELLGRERTLERLEAARQVAGPA